ncbi:hypothetical protein [Longimicrobium sp.]|uniref:hypothetical protein n=1 Tax=Longimicrobium sp. TaxID=2029185 RepID=UPI003B3A1871
MTDQAFSAREYLRARRPERFSDSVPHSRPVLDRSFLEYHLETLTNRSQEKDFEHFSRQLAEREICPNLLPQTGPTGGGDSQVDAETYPVADILALGWYVGLGREAANERWAFAFSTKKKWQDKVRTDVAKIAATARGYTKAFFISSQFISDKSRAKLEDELRTKHKIDVRILDRTWILDRVFANDHEALAIESLRIETSARPEVRRGPQDTQREEDLREVEAQIQEALREGRVGVSLVADCLKAADLARSLERPQIEVEGCYTRAQEVAEKYGTSHQCLEAAYQRAWTMYFWYEDFARFSELYSTAEKLAKGSHNAHDLELLTNLWQLLHASVQRAELEPDAVKYRQRTHVVTDELSRLSREDERPSTALQAQTLLAMIQLVRSPVNKADPILRKLKSVIERSVGLVGYPLAQLLEILTEVGPMYATCPAYEELFETMIQLRATTEGALAAARMRLERGWQHLDAKHPYEAIRSIGQALQNLSRHESRHELVRALYYLGFAYQEIGLLWAARGALLSGASIATNEFWTYSDVTPLQAACYRQLKWVELRLGRIPHVLAWHELDTSVRSVLHRGRYNADEANVQEELLFDSILGILFLKATPWQVKQCERLPDVLERLGLPISRVALLYTLGHEEEIPDEFQIEGAGEQPRYAYFARWRDQPASSEIEDPSLENERKLFLHSNLLGCRIVVEIPNRSPFVELGESILAALESFLSTTLPQGAAAREPTLSIIVGRSEFAPEQMEFQVNEEIGRPYFSVTCRDFNPHSMPLAVRDEMQNGIFRLIVGVAAHTIVIPGDWETFSNQLFGEAAPSRALSYTASFVTLSNLLGHEPKLKIAQWIRKEDKTYVNTRPAKWDHDEPQVATDLGTRGKLQSGQEPPADLLLERDSMKHTQVETVSLIRERLWNKARWKGTGFSIYDGKPRAPVLTLLFSDIDAGKQIFRSWQTELSPKDADQRLRLSIIRGIDKQNPHSYRILIGSNPEAGFTRSDIKVGHFMFRMNAMEPTSSVNLDRFLEAYKQEGKFLLAPGFAETVHSRHTSVLDHSIWKRELTVREAWSIGLHEIDGTGIDVDDDPIIPTNVKQAPVLDLLRAKRGRS